MRINCNQIPSNEAISDIEGLLKEYLPNEVKITRDGKAILIKGEDVSKREVKFIVRKALHKAHLPGQSRVIAQGHEIFNVFYKDY